ncbi:hypothetical protein ACFWBC_22765 [Streptomyces sp. NPDC059985]|uniref:hypothetical protein n=1 Tax=Streptomyces sp. NPDC059985 TaxID=3347025 RepID=UPI0036B9C7C8
MAGAPRAGDALEPALLRRMRAGEAVFPEPVCEQLPVAGIGDRVGLPKADRRRLRELTHDPPIARELLPAAGQPGPSDAATAELPPAWGRAGDGTPGPTRVPRPATVRPGHGPPGHG